MAKAKKAANVSLDFAFFQVLWQFYQANRGTIRSYQKELTKKFLDHNNPDKNPKAYLRQPQFEALEVYVFLKEFLGNAKIEEIFRDWFEKKGRFASRAEGGIVGDRRQGDIFDALTQDQYKAVFTAMRKNTRIYPNYIFALTMGTGKTILMATCIFYEFLLGNKFDKDTKYCLNALVFAPDKTVLQSLREIESFDKSRVIPPEYANFINANLKFHYLEESGTSLDTMDKSRFNIIVSNTQKIILKRKNKDKTAPDKLFGTTGDTFSRAGVYADTADLYGFDQPEDEADLTTNQRFEKLRRLEQLGIYVDEAHHAFGKTLAKDMGQGAKETDTSLRTTIDMLAASLQQSGTKVVACYNYTGTPYVGQAVLPEVVYAYGLSEAIDKGFLKRVDLFSYQNTRDAEFVDLTVNRFLELTNGLRPEGMLPKLAFFAATVDELMNELKPAVEKALGKHGIPTSSILVNVGDPKLTSNDDIREFNRLDTQTSEKQFILLVNKGREGWNCRSLFGVGMFREPKSKIFVLQATMRCLRAIGEVQHTGHVFLSEDNLNILDEELKQNFRISAEEIGNKEKNPIVQICVVEPPVTIKLVRIRKQFTVREKTLTQGVVLGLDRSNRTAWAELIEKYRLIESQRSGLTLNDAARVSSSKTKDLTYEREKREFSPLTLVAEIARYLNRSPLDIENLLDTTHEGTDELVAIANEYNELLYDEIIPRLFNLLYELDGEEQIENYEVELVKIPQKGYYEMSAKPDMTVRMGDVSDEAERAKSFHLDTYCFDSKPERQLFWDLLREQRVKKLYFTGMLTHGQSDFFIQYIDPETKAVRSYYPDFLFLRTEPDGKEKYVIVEVKGDNKMDDAVVQAKKEFAKQMLVASGMEYHLMKSSDAEKRHYRILL
jgi:hypothetical protein